MVISLSIPLHCMSLSLDNNLPNGYETTQGDIVEPPLKGVTSVSIEGRTDRHQDLSLRRVLERTWRSQAHESLFQIPRNSLVSNIE